MPLEMPSAMQMCVSKSAVLALSGDSIDRSLIKNIIRMYSALQIYSEGCTT